MAIKQRTLLHNAAFINACDFSKQGTGRIHYLGLVSDLFMLQFGAKIEQEKGKYFRLKICYRSKMLRK